MVKVKDKIDFVILWVDGNDEKWLREKSKYENIPQKDKNIDNEKIRYRDWDNLKYWFRGVEKFAPWVNKIHFITYGHLPHWLNTKNPKLNIVKHSDFMPEEALPTFNSNSIELCINNIKELSEQFVLFNDDLFLTKKVKPTDFFKKGIPCNTMSLSPIIACNDRPYYKTVNNNMEIINKYFNYSNCKKNNIFKYLSFKQGKYILRTFPLLQFNLFPGFANYHLANSYLKSTLNKIWDKEKEKMHETVICKFRDYDKNLNHWIFNYWQFAEGNFIQKRYKFGINKCINDREIPRIIKKQKYKILGLGDTNKIDDFEKIKSTVNSSFEKILPNKSSFEK